MNASLPLELLNGAGFVVDGFFVAWGVWYLWREGRRGRVRAPFWRRFLNLPAPMNFVVAVVVHDTGVLVRSGTIWAWRRVYGGGDLGSWQLLLLAAGAALIVVGGLCKIRAVTKPTYGDGPWLACLYCLAIFLAGSLVSR